MTGEFSKNEKKKKKGKYFYNEICFAPKKSFHLLPTVSFVKFVFWAENEKKKIIDFLKKKKIVRVETSDWDVVRFYSFLISSDMLQ